MNRYLLYLLFATTFILSLPGCGGGGGSGPANTGGPPNPTPTPLAASKFFVVDTQNSQIDSVIDSNLQAGTLSVDRSISGANTNLSGSDIRQLFYDKGNDDLYVANGTSVLVFNNASLATGNISPARIITSSAITSISDLYLDTSHDVLYLAISSPDQVLAFSMASTANGETTPDRTIGVSYNSGPFEISGLVLDESRDVLYIAGTSRTPATTYTPAVLVYDGASKLDNTSANYTRVIYLQPNAHTAKMYLDQTNDQLYVSDFSEFYIFVFNGASKASGTVTPARSIKYTFGTPDIAFDVKNDRMITSLSYGGSLWMIDNASTSDGDVTPVSILPPTGSFFRYPVVTD